MSENTEHILNINKTTNAFDDDNEEIKTICEHTIEIMITKRNNRKFYTNIMGIDEKFNYDKILKEIKKKFNCNGAIKINKGNNKKFIQLNGDQKENIFNFIIQEDIAPINKIKIRGI
jgi:translation initiation factor 1